MNQYTYIADVVLQDLWHQKSSTSLIWRPRMEVSVMSTHWVWCFIYYSLENQDSLEEVTIPSYNKTKKLKSILNPVILMLLHHRQWIYWRRCWNQIQRRGLQPNRLWNMIIWWLQCRFILMMRTLVMSRMTTSTWDSESLKSMRNPRSLICWESTNSQIHHSNHH